MSETTPGTPSVAHPRPLQAGEAVTLAGTVRRSSAGVGYVVHFDREPDHPLDCWVLEENTRAVDDNDAAAPGEMLADGTPVLVRGTVLRVDAPEQGPASLQGQSGVRVLVELFSKTDQYEVMVPESVVADHWYTDPTFEVGGVYSRADRAGLSTWLYLPDSDPALGPFLAMDNVAGPRLHRANLPARVSWWGNLSDL